MYSVDMIHMEAIHTSMDHIRTLYGSYPHTVWIISAHSIECLYITIGKTIKIYVILRLLHLAFLGV